MIDVWFSLLGLSYSLAHTYKFLKKLFFSCTVDFKVIFYLNKMCTINGRIPGKGQKQVIKNNFVSKTGDNYTSMSSKGKTIVDYLFTVHSKIRQINCCNVYSPLQIFVINPHSREINCPIIK